MFKIDQKKTSCKSSACSRRQRISTITLDRGIRPHVNNYFNFEIQNVMYQAAANDARKKSEICLQSHQLQLKNSLETEQARSVPYTVVY